ncbi:Metalloendoproteinase 1 [Morella rubra]|uniref:Metalloendoproteinase 1 n=1 Tax=Morella rubra TaxID=262757 RepID=A0A6A1W4P7_9ROSI|nr:Metalloendoproteinase 1 [Morella rubra]
MKFGQEFPSVTFGQLHSAVTLRSMSLILSPTPSAPSPRANEVMSQGTLACPSSCASTSASKHGRGRTRGVGLEKSLGSSSRSGKLSVYISEGECGGVSSTAATLSTKIGMLVRGLIPISVNKWLMFCRSEGVHYGSSVGMIKLDHFDLDYTFQENVMMVVETIMTARQMHRNRMHVYFKKFPSKEVTLLKPHPDTTEEQWKELCDLFTSKAFMKRSEQNKKNRSKLTVNHAAGSRSFQRTQACMKNQENCKINPAELYKKNYTNKDGVWTSKEQEKFIWDHGYVNPFVEAGGTLAHAFSPTDGRFHYDADEQWSVGAQLGAINSETVALYEIGHLLGLWHSSVGGAIMFPNIPSGVTKGLHPDDIQEIKALYNT